MGKGRNPYCSGWCSLRDDGSVLVEFATGRNPYCSGWCSLSVQLAMLEASDTGRNPYCSGWCSLSPYRVIESQVWLVAILIVVDGAL